MNPNTFLIQPLLLHYILPLCDPSSSPPEPARGSEEAVLRPAGAAPGAGRGPRPAAGRTQRPLREAAAIQRLGSLPAQRCRRVELSVVVSPSLNTYSVSIF